MQTGAITSYIDVAQLVLYAFWIFFAGLIYYLRQEDKREGYPLDSDRSERAPRVVVQGFPPIPAPKTFQLTHGGTVTVPAWQGDTREIKARPVGAWPGAPLEPTGDPMEDGVGPASYAERADKPDLTYEGHVRIVPMRAAGGYTVATQDPDPRGWPVIAGDGEVAGTIADIWVDRSEEVIRYFEVQTNGGRRVLLPHNFSRPNVWRRRIEVRSILAKHFEHVPATANPDQVTLLEEDKIMGYYGGGTLYATPDRLGPWI
jgi:photosynthetic reaction center H subunit